MPEHKITFSTDADSSPWWRAWIDNPTRDALVGVFGIAIILVVFWLLTAR